MNSRNKGAAEIWKTIPGYEELYEASNLGRIRSLPRATTNGRVLKLYCNSKNGYMYVSLSKDNVQKSRRVHRLVMAAFNGLNDGLQVNHLNGNKADNRIDNLEYCTQSENMKHAYIAGLEKPQTKKVICLNDGIIYNSVTECAKTYGGNKASQVTRVCNGKRKRFRGKRFMYYDDYLKGSNLNGNK